MNITNEKLRVLKNNMILDILIKMILTEIVSGENTGYKNIENNTFKNNKIIKLNLVYTPILFEHIKEAFDIIKTDALLNNIFDTSHASLQCNGNTVTIKMPYKYQVIGKYYEMLSYSGDLMHSLHNHDCNWGFFKEFYSIAEQIVNDFVNNKTNLFLIPIVTNTENRIRLYSFYLMEEVAKRLNMTLDSTYTICFEKMWQTYKLIGLKAGLKVLYISLLNIENKIVLMITPNMLFNQIYFDKLDVTLPEYDTEIRSDFTRYNKLLEKVILENKTFKTTFNNTLYKLDKNHLEIHKLFFYKHIMPLLLKYHNQGEYTESKNYKYVKPNRHSKKLFLALIENYTNSSFYNSMDVLLCRFFDNVAYNNRGDSSKEDLQIIIECLFDKNKFESNKYYFPGLINNLFADPLKEYGFVEVDINADRSLEEAKGLIFRMLDFNPRKYDPSVSYYTFMAIDQDRIVFNLNQYNYDEKVIAKMNLNLYKIKERERYLEML